MSNMQLYNKTGRVSLKRKYNDEITDFVKAAHKSRSRSRRSRHRRASRRRHASEDESEEDESEGEEDEEEQEMGVYSHDNHIYFKAPVCTQSVDALVKILNHKNKLIRNLKRVDLIASVKPNPIYLHISSFGGSLFAGLIAVDAIKNSQIPVYTVIDGYAASAATLMSVVGKKRFMTAHAYVLVHQLSSGASGNYEQLKDFQTNNDNIMDDMKRIYTTHTKMTKEGLDEYMQHDLWWKADKCLELGIVDEVFCENRNNSK